MPIEIFLRCKECGAEINFAEIQRIARAYTSLTRVSRRKTYSATCYECGKKSSVLNPKDAERYLCGQCKRLAKQRGYHKNILAMKKKK